MTKSKMIAVAQATVVLVALPVVIYAYAANPDAANSGVTGESSCATCHSATGTGSVTVSFSGGQTYTPGVAQTVTVTVSDAAQHRWGFQMAARQSVNSKSQAGTFTPGDDGYTQLVCTNTSYSTESFLGCTTSAYPLVYIEQTLTGTQTGTATSASYTFTWTPPASDVGSILFNVAGVAANNDNNDTGDHTYVNQYTLTPTVVQPKPAISNGGVVNGASYQQGIAAGSWFSIQGSNLAITNARTWRAGEIVNGALPTQLDGVGVTINGKPAFIEYISATQINAQAPTDAGTGPVAVVVTVNGLASTPAIAQMQTTSPAFFLWANKYAVATRQDYSYIGPATLFPGASTPAKPGGVVILWGTGFGPTTPDIAAGVVVTGAPYVTNPPSVTVGGLPAQVVGAALAPGSVGLYQIAITLPAALADGDQQVIAQADGVTSPAGVYLTIQK